MSDTTQIAERDKGAVSRNKVDEKTRRLKLSPAVDIRENSQGVTLLADLPGVTRERLEVSVHDGNLTIEAESAVPTPPIFISRTRRCAHHTFRDSLLLATTSIHHGLKPI
jgi:HSP20 family protein